MGHGRRWYGVSEWVTDGWMTDGAVRRGVSDEEAEAIGLY